jgi:hypothetical protein
MILSGLIMPPKTSQPPLRAALIYFSVAGGRAQR